MKPVRRKTAAFVIHDINAVGGQERSTLEVISRLQKDCEIHVYANTFSSLPSSVQTHHVPVLFRRPLFLKDFFFRIFVTFMLLWKKYDFVHVTGTCSFVADFITIQFIQKRWSLEKKHLPEPRSLKKCLQNFQLLCDLYWENIFFKWHQKKQYIAIAPEVEKDLRELYDLTNVTTITHGVHIEQFSPNLAERERVREQFGISKDQIILLFVGAFERKGLPFVIEAFGKSPESFRNWTLLIVGSGPVEKMKDLAQKNSVQAQIVFAGFQKNVVPFYQASDLFTLPSLYDPFGLVGIEAMACAVPSLISRQSGCSHLIQEKINGRILEAPWNADEIFEALKWCQENLNVLKDNCSRLRFQIAKESWDEKMKLYRKVFQLEEAT